MSRSAALPLLIAAALVFLAVLRGDSMGVPRKIPPQWGTSYSQIGPAGASTKQLVRVRLERPQDITVYLEGALQSDAGSFIGPVPVQYRVSIGSGGVAIEQGYVYAPAVGVARHFVADAVDVDVAPAALVAPYSRRVAAMCALGRPIESQRVGDMAFQTVAPGVFSPPANGWSVAPASVGWTTVGNGVFSWFRVPTYATQVMMQVGEFVGGAVATDMLVREEDFSGDFGPFQPPNPNPTGIQRTVADYAAWQSIAPQTAYLRMRCNVAGGSARVLVSWLRVM
jgi:hypothetical protein